MVSAYIKTIGVLYPPNYLLFLSKTIMKNKIFILITLLFISFAMNAQKIYSEDAAYKADVKIYVVDAEYKADLLVYKVDAEYKAGKNDGKWFFVDATYKAEKKIYFVDAEYKADLKIYFVDAAYKASWKNKNKKHLLY